MKTIANIIEAMKGTVTSVGLDPKFKYSRNNPAPKMPIKDGDIEGARALGEEAKKEFDAIIKELTKGIKNFDTAGRVKDAVSLARKAASEKVELSMIDDLVGMMIITDTIEDEETVAQRMHDDERFFKIYDFLSDPNCGAYYGVHGDFVASNGVVGELQILTKYQRAAKSLVGHILYEVRREIFGKTNNKELKSVQTKVEETIEKFYIDTKKADKARGKVPYPNIDITDAELEATKKVVTPKTYERFLTVIDGTCIKNNTKISAEDKAHFEQKSTIKEHNSSLKEYVNNYVN